MSLDCIHNDTFFSWCGIRSHPLAPYRIRRMLPNARIIINLREPAERAFSAFCHVNKNRFAQGLKPIRSFHAIASRGVNLANEFMVCTELFYECEMLELEKQRCSYLYVFRSQLLVVQACRDRAMTESQAAINLGISSLPYIKIFEQGLSIEDLQVCQCLLLSYKSMG